MAAAQMVCLLPTSWQLRPQADTLSQLAKGGIATQ